MDFCKCDENAQADLRIAIATVPEQPWETPYQFGQGLKQGTIFPSLDLPFYVTGGENHG